MSNCVVLSNGDFIIVASDSAVSKLSGDSLVRFGENQRKIFPLENCVIFCSGNLKYVKKVIDFLKNKKTILPEEIYCFLKEIEFLKSNFFNLEILIVYMSGDVFQLSEYEFFVPKKLSMDKNNLNIYSAGFMTQKMVEILEEEFLKNRDVISGLTNAYKKISCEEIGGKLEVWKVSNREIIKIAEKIDIDSFTLHSVVGEVVVGKILAGNTLTIANGANNFVLDETGATLNNAKFTLQTTNTKVNIDPTALNVFSIQKNEGGTFNNKFWVDGTGNVNFAGTLSGANGSFTGTLTATAGSIGGLTINAQGIQKDSNNYIRSNGDLKWGGLTITGSTATFAGDIFANKLVGTVDWSQIVNAPLPTSKFNSGTGYSASGITAGTMSGNRLYGGTPTFNGVTPVGSDLAVYGNLQIVGGAILSQGNITTIGVFFTPNGYYSAGGAGVSTSRSVNTPLGTKIITFSGGICVGFT